MADVKLCKDCKWCEMDYGPSLARCWSPKAIKSSSWIPNKQSPIDGSVKSGWCESQRSSGWIVTFLLGIGGCSKSGRFWEAR